jgi:hypothetical protein
MGPGATLSTVRLRSNPKLLVRVLVLVDTRLCMFECNMGLGTYILWVDTQRSSVLGKRRWKFGCRRATVVLSAAIFTDLGPDVGYCSND